MQKIVLATGNSHKTQEIREILGAGFEVLDISDFPEVGEIIEDADTFEGNADLKALAISRLTDSLVIADDSGLCVDALDEAPGIRSARYAGEQATMEQNKTLLLQNLIGESNRSAKFVCVLSVARSGQIVTRFRGECPGSIISEEHGSGGFGYDPLFIPSGYEQTFAQLGAEIKNELSHRGKAMELFQQWINA